jgi:AhpD family alkylhydroperoxidase
MSRIALLTAPEAPFGLADLYADGDPGPIVAALAHIPELAEVTLPFLGAVLGPSAVGLRTKEIVILRSSAMLGCRYCVDAHTVVARDASLSVDEVRALRGEGDVAAAFAEDRERALIAWVDAVAVGPGDPPAAVAAAMAERYADADLVELTLLVGTTVMLNRFATCLQLPTGERTRSRLDAEGWS